MRRRRPWRSLMEELLMVEILGFNLLSTGQAQNPFIKEG